jgi:hypothetical protein
MGGVVRRFGHAITGIVGKTLAKTPNALPLFRRISLCQPLAKSPKPLKFQPFLKFL